MELEFERDTIVGYETVAEVTLCQEETQESIVPDACPDILRIVDVCGQAVLLSKQAQENGVQVGGAVCATILYRPEEGGGLRHMEMRLPFSCRAETPGLTPEGKVLASACLRSAEARILNPRKVLLRVDLEIKVTACQPREHTICTCVPEEKNQDICQRQYRSEHYYISDVQEKPFTFEDQIRLKASQGEFPRLLASQVQPVCTESKIIGNKLIFKGTTEVSLLLLDPDGALSSSHESLPFSQIMEVAGGGEDSDCEVTVDVTEYTCEDGGDGGQSLSLRLELLAQAQVRCRRPIVMLQDLYSTVNETKCDVKEQTLCCAGEHTVIPQSVRELLETPDSVRTVVSSRLSLNHLQQNKEENALVLSVDAALTLLYLDENEQLQCVRRAIPVSCRLECSSQTSCRCHCICPSEVYAAPSAGGIEVRFNVEFHCTTWTRHSVPAICGVEIEGPREQDKEGSPSVVLRLASPGEGLWDIAKAYGTTMEQIAQANGLDDDLLPEGTMLLIPSLH